MAIYLKVFIFGLLFALFACSPHENQKTPEQDTTSIPSVEGWIEATAIVRDAEKQADFFTKIAGYERIFTGNVSPGVLQAWGLPQAVSGLEILLRESSESRGFVRLIQLSNVANQMEARSAGTFIDTGGIMGLNVRVKDIQKTFDNLQAAGWRPLSDPVSFSVENFSVAEAIFLGPDGLVIGLIERQKPALGPEWRMTPGKLSRPNNAFIITSDIQQTSEFYKSSLGWHAFLEDKVDEAAQSGMNIYGWPHELAKQVSRHVMWMHPQKTAETREGTIALIELDGVEGRDFSARTRPPNLGWTSLRVFSGAEADTVEKQSNPFQIFPYGCVTLAVTHDPDGTQLEYLRASTGCETNE